MVELTLRNKIRAKMRRRRLVGSALCGLYVFGIGFLISDLVEFRGIVSCVVAYKLFSMMVLDKQQRNQLLSSEVFLSTSVLAVVLVSIGFCLESYLMMYDLVGPAVGAGIIVIFMMVTYLSIEKDIVSQHFDRVLRIEKMLRRSY